MSPAGELALEASERGGVVKQQIERPREAGRGGLVAGEQQGHQLVAELAITHLRAVLEARGQQQGEDVVAIGEVGAPPVLGDLRVEQVVGPPADVHEPAEDGQAPQARRREADRRRRAGGREDLHQSCLQALAASGVLDPEDGAQDHLEGDRLHAGVQRELRLARPARDRALGRLADRVLVAPHALAMKRRQHELAPAQVLVALLKQQRRAAEDRLQEEVAPGRDRVDPIRREQGLDGGRIGEEDDIAGAQDARAERLAQLSAPVLEERQRAEDEPRRLHGLRQWDRGRGGDRRRWRGDRGLGYAGGHRLIVRTAGLGGAVLRRVRTGSDGAFAAGGGMSVELSSDSDG